MKAIAFKKSYNILKSQLISEIMKRVSDALKNTLATEVVFITPITHGDEVSTYTHGISKDFEAISSTLDAPYNLPLMDLEFAECYAILHVLDSGMFYAAGGDIPKNLDTSKEISTISIFEP